MINGKRRSYLDELQVGNFYATDTAWTAVDFPEGFLLESGVHSVTLIGKTQARKIYLYTIIPKHNHGKSRKAYDLGMLVDMRILEEQNPVFPAIKGKKLVSLHFLSHENSFWIQRIVFPATEKVRPLIEIHEKPIRNNDND